MILIEGYTLQQILSLTDEQIEALVLTGEPLVFRAGSAEVLGEFRIEADRLVIELAQIEGGGEGVLIALWRLAGQLAARRGLGEVEWIVHAVHCAQPNLKLRRVLERRGFGVRDLPGSGAAYHLVQAREPALTPGPSPNPGRGAGVRARRVDQPAATPPVLLPGGRRH